VDNFDIIIKLKANYCPNAYQSIDLCEGTFLPHYKDYDKLDNDKTFPIVDFDIADKFVGQLRKCFSDLIEFFYDRYSSTRIYGLWKQDSIKTKDIKLSNTRYGLIDQTNNKLELNVEAIVEDFKIIGHGLVDNIEIKNFK
jgi:U3 small nucleolar RNA-associated protein 22